MKQNINALICWFYIRLSTTFLSNNGMPGITIAVVSFGTVPLFSYSNNVQRGYVEKLLHFSTYTIYSYFNKFDAGTTAQMRAREINQWDRETVYYVALCCVPCCHCASLCQSKALWARARVCICVSVWTRMYVSTMRLLYTNGKAFRINEQQQNPFNRIQFVTSESLRAR